MAHGPGSLADNLSDLGRAETSRGKDLDPGEDASLGEAAYRARRDTEHLRGLGKVYQAVADRRLHTPPYGNENRFR